MKDLYKRLGLDPAAPDDAVRRAAAAPSVEAATRLAAEAILLDPRRRPVYDKNRALLVRIGELRSRLAMQRRPFWLRGDFHDFTYEPPVPTGPAESQRIAAALASGGASGYYRHPRDRRKIAWIIGLILIAICTVAGSVALYFAWRSTSPY